MLNYRRVLIKTSKMSKVLVAEYRGMSLFKIPKDINLEDKTMVKDYGVKWDKLYIEFVDTTREELIIKASSSDDIDYKYPNETSIQLVEDLEDDYRQSLSDYESDEEEETSTAITEEYIGEVGSLNWLMGLPVSKYNVTDLEEE